MNIRKILAINFCVVVLLSIVLLFRGSIELQTSKYYSEAQKALRGNDNELSTKSKGVKVETSKSSVASVDTSNSNDVNVKITTPSNENVKTSSPIESSVNAEPVTRSLPSNGQDPSDPVEQEFLKTKSYAKLLNLRAERRRLYQCPKTTIPDPVRGRVEVYQGPYKNNYKILCWLMAYKGDFPEKVSSNLMTWGRRCDRVAVLSNYDDPEWFTYDVHVDETGDKNVFIKKAFSCWSFLFRQWRDEYDFFVKADTDSFIIVENLRLYLDKYGRTDTPFYSGKRFQINGNQDIFVAGAAEIVNRPALDRLVCEIEKSCPEPIKELWQERPLDGVPEMPNRKRCEIKPGNHEDVLVARCLSWWGVFAEDSRDEEGKEFFHVTTMSSTFRLPKMQKPGDYGWMSRYMKWGYLGGEKAVHKHSAVFHYYKQWPKIWVPECDLYPISNT